MKPRMKNVIATSAVGLLLAGGAVAAVTATGQSKKRSSHAAARTVVRVSGRDVDTAASYLGVSSSQLAARLAAGQSLAQVADATPGRSASGLINAIVAAKRETLAGARAAGTVTQTRQTALLASLRKRVGRLVKRSFAPHPSG